MASERSNRTSNIETVQLLLDRGADPFIRNKRNKNAIDVCPTDECKELISQYMWPKMYNADMQLANIYRERINEQVPFDVWRIILLRKRQQQLCKVLTDESNKELLVQFAKQLYIPITKNMTKAELCALISKKLVRS